MLSWPMVMHPAPALRQTGCHRDRQIGEWTTDAGDSLGLLMAFAGNQDHIAGCSRVNGPLDRCRPVRYHLHRVARAHAGENVGDDLLRVFVARVVVGHDHVVGKLDRHLAHRRAFAAVAIAATAKHAPEPTAAVCTRRFQSLAQRISRMGEIDQHCRLAADPGTGCMRPGGAVQSARAPATRASGQPSASRMPAASSRFSALNLTPQTALDYGDPRSPLNSSTRPSAPSCNNPPRSRAAELPAMLTPKQAVPAATPAASAKESSRLITAARAPVAEQACLGLAVVLQIAVIVEMIAAQVAERDVLKCTPSTRRWSSACEDTSMTACRAPASASSRNWRCSVMQPDVVNAPGRTAVPSP